MHFISQRGWTGLSELRVRRMVLAFRRSYYNPAFCSFFSFCSKIILSSSPRGSVIEFFNFVYIELNYIEFGFWQRIDISLCVWILIEWFPSALHSVLCSVSSCFLTTEQSSWRRCKTKLTNFNLLERYRNCVLTFFCLRFRIGMR